MKVYKPEDMNAAFAEAFNSGNIENLMALYEPDAVLVPKPGLVVEGTEALRAALQELLDLRGYMQSENQYALVHGDIALLRAKVHLAGTAPDGARLEINNHTAEVVRRQPDGSWLYILDHPYGADPLNT
ncbi:MAG TPA: SgcJ/EcaC family oxidoreductase [Pyrinomonadaceae bacterium]|nr:SgcJ/EcaC family oxidoreductase [Pyrinomonadaceae bacterium]